MYDIRLTTPDNRTFDISPKEYDDINQLIRECADKGDCGTVYKSCTDCPLYIIACRHARTYCSDVLEIMNHKHYTFGNVQMRIFD